MVSLCLLVGALQSWVGTSCSNDPATNSSSNFPIGPGVENITSLPNGVKRVKLGIGVSGANPQLPLYSYRLSPELFFVPAGSRFNKDGLGRVIRASYSKLFDMDDENWTSETFDVVMKTPGVFRVYSAPRKCKVLDQQTGACEWMDLPAQSYVEACTGFPNFVVNSGFEPQVFAYADPGGNTKFALLSLVLPDSGTPANVKLEIGNAKFDLSVNEFDAVSNDRYSMVSQYLKSVAVKNSKIGVLKVEPGFKYAGVSVDLETLISDGAAGKFGKISFDLGRKSYTLPFICEGRWLKTGDVRRSPAEFLAYIQFGNQNFGFSEFNLAYEYDGKKDVISSALHSNLIVVQPGYLTYPEAQELPDAYYGSFSRIDFSGLGGALESLKGGEFQLETDYNVSLRYLDASVNALIQLPGDLGFSRKRHTYRISGNIANAVINNGIWAMVLGDDMAYQYMTADEQLMDYGKQWDVTLNTVKEDVTRKVGSWRGFKNDRPLLFRAKINTEFKQDNGLPKIVKSVSRWIPSKNEILPKDKTTFKISRSPFVEEMATDVGATSLVPIELVKSKAVLSISDYDKNTSVFNVAPPASFVDGELYNGMYGVKTKSGSYKIISSLDFRPSKTIAYVIAGDPANGQSSQNVVNFSSMTGAEFVNSKSSKAEILASTLQSRGQYVEIVDLKKWNLGKVYALNDGHFFPDASENQLRELGILLNGNSKSSAGEGEADATPMMVKYVLGLGSSSANEIKNDLAANLSLMGREFIPDEVDASGARDVGAKLINNPNALNYYRGMTMNIGKVNLCRAAGNSSAVCQLYGTYSDYEGVIDEIAIDAFKTVGPMVNPVIDWAVTAYDFDNDWKEGRRLTAVFNAGIGFIPVHGVWKAGKRFKAGHEAEVLERKLAEALEKELPAFEKRITDLGIEVVNGKIKADKDNLVKIFANELNEKQIDELAAELEQEFGKEKVEIPVLRNRRLGKQYETQFENMVEERGAEWNGYVVKFAEKCGEPCIGMKDFKVAHQVQINLPDGRYFIADNVWKNGKGNWIIDDTKLTLGADFTDNQRAAIKALENGQVTFSVRSAERGGKGFWEKGENIVIEYFGRTNGNGDPMSKIYEPSRIFP